MEMKKTEKPVIIPLSEEAKRWLPDPKGFNVPFFDIPTTGTVIGRALRKWAEAAGIDKHLSFHCSRHTFGTMMLTLGADLYTTSKLLGHTDVKMTQVYAKIINRKKDEAVNLVNGLFD
jgi:integrase